MQNLMKSGFSHQDTRPRLEVDAWIVAKESRIIAKSRLEAKKQKWKYSIPLPSSPFPALIEHPSFYGGCVVPEIEFGVAH